jgi:hypothetical protein
MTLLRTVLSQEIRAIMMKHLDELVPYIPAGIQAIQKAPESVLGCVERLLTICEVSPEEASYDLYTEASECYEAFEDFLKSMNQMIDSDFKDMAIGEIWAQANQWRQQALKQFQLTLPEVWTSIAPAAPDCLVDIGNGQYEARWWKPVPMMDIEILKHTEGVSIHGEPFEPPNLEGGLACRFSLSLCHRDKCYEA